MCKQEYIQYRLCKMMKKMMMMMMIVVMVVVLGATWMLTKYDGDYSCEAVVRLN